MSARHRSEPCQIPLQFSVPSSEFSIRKLIALRLQCLPVINVGAINDGTQGTVMVRKAVTPNRVEVIYKRQKSPSWGRDYLPGILATKEEAPDISRASILTPGVFQRQVHCLCEPEKYFTIFGCYSKKFSGLQEQRMMAAHTTLHPLSTMKAFESVRLPAISGIVEVAERIGATNILKTGTVYFDEERREAEQIVLPFFSDLLWACGGENGETTGCLNWNIKDVQDGFGRRLKRKNCGGDQDEDVIARQTIERLLYQSGGIRTHQLSLDQLDINLRENLLHLFLHHRRHVALSEDIRFELHERFLSALQADIPPFDVILDSMRHAKFDLGDARTYLWQLIWNRELRVDLFSALLLIDRPLRPEKTDPLEKYAIWFAD